MTQSTTEPLPHRVRPEDSMDERALRLEVAKWRVIAFWQLPEEVHDLVTGTTAQQIEDSAHKLAGLLGILKK